VFEETFTGEISEVDTEPQLTTRNWRNFESSVTRSELNERQKIFISAF